MVVTVEDNITGQMQGTKDIREVSHNGTSISQPINACTVILEERMKHCKGQMPWSPVQTSVLGNDKIAAFMNSVELWLSVKTYTKSGQSILQDGVDVD